MIDPTEYLLVTLMGTGVNRATAEQLLAEHDAIKSAAVLREAADAVEADPQCHRPYHRAYYADKLRRRADEIREQATPAGATDTLNTRKDGRS